MGNTIFGAGHGKHGRDVEHVGMRHVDMEHASNPSKLGTQPFLRTNVAWQSDQCRLQS